MQKGEFGLIWDVNVFREQYNKIRMDTCPTFNLRSKSGKFPVHSKALIFPCEPRKVSERSDGCVGTKLNLGRGPNG